MLSEEQLRKRKLGIGGSDAAAVMGKCPWKTAVEVYLDKLSPSIDQEEKDCFWWGNSLEEKTLKWYERKTGEILLPYNEDTKRFFKEHHEVYTWMRANIDGYIFNKNIIVEAKASGQAWSPEWGTPGTNEMPDYYLITCAHYRIIYDAPKVDLPVFFNIHDQRIYTYYENKELEKKIIEREREFWHDNVLKEIPPEPTNLHDSALLWPNSIEKTKIANNDTYMQIYQYNGIKLKIKELEEEADTLKLKIQQEMGENDTLVNVNNQKLATWKTQTTKRIDFETFKKTHPDLYIQHLKESSSRVFRLGKLDT